MKLLCIRLALRLLDRAVPSDDLRLVTARFLLAEVLAWPDDLNGDDSLISEMYERKIA